MIVNAKAALAWTGKIHAYSEPLPDQGYGKALCDRTTVNSTTTGFENRGAVPMGRSFPVPEEDLQPMPDFGKVQGVAEFQSHCNFCLAQVSPDEVCKRTRDMLEHDPELAGRLILHCDRRAMHSGKHRDSSRAVDWWG